MKNNFGPRKRLTPFAEGGKFFHQVPLEVGALISRFKVILGGSLVIAGGAANGAFVGENPGAFTANIDLDGVVNSEKGKGFIGGKLVSLTARTLCHRRSFDRGYLTPDFSLGAGGLTGAAGTFVLAQPYTIHRALPRLKESFGYNSALPCDAYSSLVLSIKMNTKAVINPTTDRVWTETGMYYDVYDDRAYPSKPYKVVELFDTDQPFIINAMQSRTPIGSELPQDGGYLDILLIAQTTAALTLTDTIVNRVTWKSGTQELFDAEKFPLKILQQRYVTDFADSMTGLFFCPFDRDGMLSSAEAGISGLLDLSNPGGAGADLLTVASRRINVAPTL